MRFKAISFLINASIDLLLILDLLSWIIGFFIKVDTMFLESNISRCLCSGEGKFSPEGFPVIKNEKHCC